MSVNFNSGSYLIRDILQNTNSESSITYAADDEDKTMREI